MSRSGPPPPGGSQGRDGRAGRLRRRLVRRGGPLTDELARAPGGFGLGQVPADRQPDEVVAAVCGFCSTGCSLDVHRRHGEPVNLTPTRAYPVNRGSACPKGWESLTPLGAADRATTPLVRNPRGALEPVTWEVALHAFASRVKAIQRAHGPESVAFLSTGQIPTEEMALLGAVAKFGMGMVHGDGNTRQCMATSVVAYKESFGFDAPPYAYADLEESDAIVLVGSNLCIAHPILWERVARNRRHPEIVVVDPRRTETAMAATQHLALAPKSDLVFFYGVAAELIRRGWIDRPFIEAHTSGFEEMAAHVARFGPGPWAEATGLTVADLDRLVTTIHERERVSFWWTMGVNQSHQGVRTAQAIINLALLTGNIGRPGTGANSITGQANAMGSRLFSNTTNLFGGRDFANPLHREEVATVLGIETRRIPSQPSLAYDQIIEGMASGRIRGLWVIATNPAHSWVNQGDTRELLDRLDLLVVQDMYRSTETARLADIVLPAAGWGEKDGTFINSERRIGRIRAVARPPGEAVPDFEIFRRVADAYGCGHLFDDWSGPEAVFAILARLSAGRPCDFSALDGADAYQVIEAAGGVQWPVPAGSVVAAGEHRLFADGRFFHADGRARFVVDDPRPVREPTRDRYPFMLLTGRGSSAQWHTQTRTAKSALLRALAPTEAYVEMAPADAERLGIVAGAEVVVASVRGSMRARAVVTPTIAAGQVFVPMHDEQTNRLTEPSFDPHSRQPAFKSCAVAVRLPEPWD